MSVVPSSGVIALRAVAGRVLPLLGAVSCILPPAAPVSAQPAAGCETPHVLPASGADLRVDPAGRLCSGSPLASRTPFPDTTASRPDAPARPGTARSFASSLVLPGAGQWLQGQRRAYLYLGVELLAWGAFLEGRLDGAGLRDRYRDLAWRVARGGEGDRALVGDFRYYEALAEYSTSGAWDRDPTRPGLQPETDPDTYNGDVWSLARELYSLTDGSGSEYGDAHAGALEYYREHGYPPGMAWDWSRDPAAAERFRQLIEESDDAFRRATIVLAMIAANHVLSAVDGFLSARIATDHDGDAAARRVMPGGQWDRTRWRLEFRVGGGR